MPKQHKQVNYIYVCYSKLTPFQVKIGITDNLQHRLNAFHTTDHTAQFVHVMRVNSRKKVFDVETNLHHRFASANSTRGKEWFHINLPLFLWLLEKGALWGIFVYWVQQILGGANELNR